MKCKKCKRTSVIVATDEVSDGLSQHRHRCVRCDIAWSSIEVRETSSTPLPPQALLAIRAQVDRLQAMFAQVVTEPVAAPSWARPPRAKSKGREPSKPVDARYIMPNLVAERMARLGTAPPAPPPKSSPVPKELLAQIPLPLHRDVEKFRRQFDALTSDEMLRRSPTPLDLRGRVVDFLPTLRRHGVSVPLFAAALGVHENSIAGWQRALRGAVAEAA